MKPLSLLFFSFCFFVLCFSQESNTTYHATYDLELVQVKNLTLDSLLKRSSENLLEDDYLSFSLNSGSETFSQIVINNKTDSACKIYWDSAYCIDILGNDFGIMHVANPINQDQSQAPSVIAPMSEITPLIAPKGSVGIIDGKWECTPKMFNTKQAVMAYQKYGNKRISFFIPVETQGEVIGYLFECKIVNFQINENTKGSSLDYYRNKELVYEGHGYYSIGNKQYRYNKREFHSLLYQTENQDVVNEFKKVNKLRITSNVLRPVGIGIAVIGAFIALDASGEIYHPVSIVGFGVFATSISFNIVCNQKLKLVPDIYKPYK